MSLTRVVKRFADFARKVLRHSVLVLCAPSSWTWIVTRAALNVHGMHTNSAFKYVVFLLDVRNTPRALIGTDKWTRPLVTVELVMTWMEIKVAFAAVFGDKLRHRAEAIRALRKVSLYVLI